MSRISEKFMALREKKEKALIVYLTAGDPSLAITKELILALENAGADILEIGVPFSDPTADGPVIQAAAQRALKGGATLTAILEMIKEVRRVSQIPIVLFGYYNPIFVYGGEKFARHAARAGVDGVLVVDLPPEEAPELREFTDAAGIDFIFLIAPTTGAKRTRQIAAGATGFLYYISITGITGTAAPKIADIETAVSKLRKITKLPVAVGFGITNPEQAGQIGKTADGVIVGSAVVRLIDENRNSPDLIKIVADFTGALKKELQ
ncbi:MAG TPA: tryptophan synthase subunit alpha [Smithellaceae bacterium]|nr:tryptophan synthase subunit alpha [Smithellaceae bacterium]